MARVQVFTNQSSDGNSTVLRSPGGDLKAHVLYNSGSGSITVQTSPDDGTNWFSVGTDGELTGTGQVAFVTSPGEQVRINLASSSGADIDAWISHAMARPPGPPSPLSDVARFLG